jgi:hypothetical protein
MYTRIMKPSITVHKKGRGRPATGQDPLVSFRIPAASLDAIDRFRAEQEGDLSRSEAIRLLIRDALTSAGYLQAEDEG